MKACDNKLRDGKGREAGLESRWRATVDWRKMQIAFVSEPSIAKHKTFEGQGTSLDTVLGMPTP